MKASRGKRFAGKRREAVVEVLAQALLGLVLRGRSAAGVTVPGVRKDDGRGDHHASR
jgi:hypothetical protein